MATTDASAPARLPELTLEFLGYLELERGLSRNTLDAYRSDLEQYGAYLRPRRSRPAPGDAGRTGRRSCPAGGGARGRGPVAPATLQRKIACLRSFYRHLRREQLIDYDPTSELRPPRSRARLPEVLNRDEVGRLLAQPRGTTPVALRDRALLETMYACGLRASEATGSSSRSSTSRQASCARAEGVQRTARADREQGGH